jgi:hypothetical protein
MGTQINIGDHASSVKDFVAIPNYDRQTAIWARSKAREIARTIPNANRYLCSLPKGRSLSDLLEDSTIWVNYGPGLPGYGRIDMYTGKEIAISPIAFRKGRWTVLATLIHELAHANDAPESPSTAAEDAVLACGLGKRSEQSTGDDPCTPYVLGLKW